MLQPVNKHLVVNPEEEQENDSLVLVPDEYREESSRYIFVELVRPNDESKLKKGMRLLVLSHLMEEVVLDGQVFHIIPENSVIGYVDS